MTTDKSAAGTGALSAQADWRVTVSLPRGTTKRNPACRSFVCQFPSRIHENHCPPYTFQRLHDVRLVWTPQAQGDSDDSAGDSDQLADCAAGILLPGACESPGLGVDVHA